MVYYWVYHIIDNIYLLRLCGGCQWVEKVELHRFDLILMGKMMIIL